MPCGALHHLSLVMHPHCETCEFLFCTHWFQYYKQSLAPPLQPRGAAGHCNGTLCGLRARWRRLSHCKRFCYVISWRIGAVIQTTTAVDCAADQTGGPGAHYISHFILSWGPSFISDIYSWIGAPPLRGLLALRLRWGPTSHSGKTRCIWLALPGSTCVFCLARAAGGGERANYQLPLRDQYDVILPLRHNRLQMRGARPLGSLIHLTKSRKA